MTLPWERDPTFFARLLKSNEKHHFVPRSAVLKEFLEPSEWVGETNRDNHLRELSVGSGVIGWRGSKQAAQQRNLNFAGAFSSERYWTGDDEALLAGRRSYLDDGRIVGTLVMVPAIATMPLRPPSFMNALAAQFAADGAVNPTDDAKRGLVLIADRVRRDWVVALDRGYVSVMVHRVRENVDALFVIGDVPVEVLDARGRRVPRPAWLWSDEWFPGAFSREPIEFVDLDLWMPISSRVAVSVQARRDRCRAFGFGRLARRTMVAVDRLGLRRRLPAFRVSAAEEVQVDAAYVQERNRRTIARAAECVWAGRRQDLV